MSIQGQVTCRTKWILQEKQLVWLVLPTKEVDIKSKIQTDFLSIIHYDDHDLKMRLTKEKKNLEKLCKDKGINNNIDNYNNNNNDNIESCFFNGNTMHLILKGAKLLMKSIRNRVIPSWTYKFYYDFKCGKQINSYFLEPNGGEQLVLKNQQ